MSVNRKCLKFGYETLSVSANQRVFTKEPDDVTYRYTIANKNGRGTSFNSDSEKLYDDDVCVFCRDFFSGGGL